MFAVYDKRDSKKYMVYSTQKNKNGYVDFLIRKNEQWLWQSAKYYMTLQEYQEV